MDECAQDTDGCAQTCANNNGSFLCSCGTGYTLANDGLGCDGKSLTMIGILQCTLYIFSDIDECIENTDGCAQTCTNNVGSFVCSCDIGYFLAANNMGCDGECL